MRGPPRVDGKRLPGRQVDRRLVLGHDRARVVVGRDLDVVDFLPGVLAARRRGEAEDGSLVGQRVETRC